MQHFRGQPLEWRQQQQLVSSTWQVFNSCVYKSPAQDALSWWKNQPGRPTSLAHSSMVEGTNETYPWSFSANKRGARPGLNSWTTGGESWISCMSSWDQNVEKCEPVPGMQRDKLDMIWRVSHRQLRSSSNSPWWNRTPCQNRSYQIWIGREACAAGASQDLKTNGITNFIFHRVEQARVSRLTALSQSSAPSYLKYSNMNPSEDSVSEQVLSNIN